MGAPLLGAKAEALAGVAALADRAPPGLVVEVPTHGFLQGLLKGLGRRPADLGLRLARIDRVAAVVAGTVGDERDQILVRSVLRPQPVEGGAERLHHGEVVAHRAPAQQIGLADPAALQHRHEAARVILDVDPIALVQPVAVDRQLAAFERVEDHQRDQLLREVARPVIVRAVRHQHRQAVGLVPRPRQVVGGRLRGGVGRARIVSAVLGEERVRRQRTVDLVRRDVEEAEPRLRLRWQRLVVAARGIQHHLRADHVGLDEGARIGDRAVDVAFRRQVHHRLRREVCEGRAHGIRVADVGLDKAVAGIVGEAIQRHRVGRVGQRVQRQHVVAEVAHEMEHESGADEAATSGHQNAHGRPFLECVDGRREPGPQNTGPRSDRRGAALSLSDRIASAAETGQSMPTSGSSHARARSWAGL